VDPLVAVVACAAVAAVAYAVGRMRRPLTADPAPVEPGVPQAVATLAGLVHTGVIFVGPHDEVLAATEPARTLGLVRGSRVAHAEVLDLAREVRRTNEPITRALALARRGMEKSYLTVTVAVLTDDVIAVVADDSTAFRRMDEARRDFVTNVSHELKTPIGAISILAEAVQSAADDPQAVGRFAQRMHVESARLSELVGQIITLSRLQSQDPLRNAGRVAVADVIAEAVDRHLPAAKRRHVNLTVNLRDPGEVTADSAQLVDAVANMVANAITYSHEGARVAVAAQRTDRDSDPVVEITVTDNGIGIPAAEQELVFERFYRVDPHRSRASGGTGLGLSIVRLVAEAHGGSVSLWSRVGQGSTFTIILPALMPVSTTGPEAAPEAKRKEPTT
jgi:two-component system sensor histidine kinase SenX3